MLIRQTISLVAVFTACLASKLPECPTGWYPRPGSSFCYQFNNKAAYDWQSADQRCRSLGGLLVSIKDAAEKEFIAELAHEDATTADSYLIGLFYPGTLLPRTTNWQWTDNSTWTLADRATIDWDIGKPSNTRGQDCVELSTKTSKMNNVACSGYAKSYICKRDVNAPIFCDEDWQHLGDYCFQSHDWTYDWADAVDHCQEYHEAELIFLTSDNENQYVRDLLNQYNVDKFWLGATVDRFKNIKWDTVFKNVTMIPPKWAFGEPKVPPFNETKYCVNMWKSDYKWHAESCTMKASIACKKTTSGCHQKWDQYNGNCYQINEDYQDYVSWQTAWDHCKDQNAALVDIKSANENQNLYWSVRESTWIAVTNDPAIDPSHAGNFYWATDKRDIWDGGYHKFYQNQTTKHQGYYDCGYADESYSAQGSWFTTFCNNTNYFVCKAPVGQIVHPSSEQFADYYCPPGFVQWAANCYLISTNKLNWIAAMEQCKANGSNLVDFLHQEGVQFVNGETKEKYWTALNRRSDPTKWVWDKSGSGTAAVELGTFKYWDFWYPYSTADYNCVYSDVYRSFSGDFQGKWRNGLCEDERKYVCKQSAKKLSEQPPSVSSTAWPVECGPYWTFDKVTKTCYRASDEPHTWVDAQASCKAYGGQLASLHSGQDTTEALAYVRQFFQGNADIWIGANDRSISDGFEWSDGTGFNYYNWAPGEPSDGGTAAYSEDCVQLLVSSGQWEDIQCSFRRPYLCKKIPPQYQTATTQATIPPSPKPGVSWTCDAGWKAFGDYCYKLDGELATYEDAKKYCRRMDGDLASIHTKNENLFIFSNTPSRVDYAWTGLDQIGHVGLFTWTDGTDVNYTPWQVGEPHGARAQDFCVRMVVDADWQTIDCTNLRRPVCKKQKTWQVAPTSPAYTGCPPNWLFYNENCYFFSTTMQTWGMASTFCKGIGSGTDLVKIASSRENAFIASTLSTQTGKYNIGLQKAIGSTLYRWPDGTTSNLYSNWNENFPNDNFGNCVGITSGTEAGIWQNVGCYNTAKWICKSPRQGFTTAPTTPTTTLPASQRCPGEWIRSEQNCYLAKTMIGSDRKTWEAARGYCAALGADLVSIHTPEENSFVLQNVTGRYRSAPYWIGLNTLDGVQKWSDGLGVGYTNYGSPPDNAHGNEKCFDFDAWTSGAWNDATCSIAKSWICKAPLGHLLRATPAPTAQPGSPQCFGGDAKWKLWAGACYYVAAPFTTKTFFEARQECQSYGSYTDLVSIHSIEEENLLIGMITSLSYNYYNFWIGLTELASLGATNGLAWTDNTAYDFTNYWALGQPSDGGFSETNGCTMMSYVNGEWLSHHCGKKLNYICKHYVNPPTTPSPPPPISGNCPEGWTSIGTAKCVRIFGGTNYTVSPSRTWKSALQFCKNQTESNLHPNLLSIPDLEYQLQLIPLLYKSGQSSYWIGLNSFETTGAWIWSDNSQFYYKNWGVGKPDNQAFWSWYSDDCVSMSGLNDATVGTWDDNSCTSYRPFICQQDPSPLNPTQAPTEQQCTEGFTPYLNSCYRLTTAVGTYDEVEKECTGYGEITFLTSIVTYYEQLLITSFAAKAKKPLWIGMSDRNKDKRYEWADGWPALISSPWKHGEPTALDGQGCVIINTDGSWEDIYCNVSTYQGICKYTSDVKPTISPPGYCTKYRGCPATRPGVHWIDGGDCYCYAVFDTPANQANAEKSCVQMDAHLASITSASENKWIKENIRSQQTANMWIGFIQKATGGFKWTDGNGGYYLNWLYPPSQTVTYNQDCTVMLESGKWSDLNCVNLRPYVCKVYKEYRPEPTWASPPACFGDNNWKSWNGQCYYVSKGSSYNSWQQCNKHCHDQKGDLVSILSVDENKFVVNLLKNWAYSWEDKYWIGLNEIMDSEGILNWADGSIVNFNYFAEGHNETDPSKGCVFIDKSTGKWSRSHCAVQHSCVCKRAQNATVAPPTILPPVKVGGCKEGWISYPESDKCYKFVDEPRQFHEAQRSCKIQGGSSGHGTGLVAINSALEQDFIITQIPSHPGNRWIGLKFDRDSWTHRWVDQTEFSYRNWNVGEPNGAYWNEDCVEMHSSRDKPGKWNDIVCASTRPYICQMPKDPNRQLQSPYVNNSYCPSGYSYFDYTQACYKLLDAFTSATDGEKKCQADFAGAHLVSISDGFEESIVRVLMGWKKIPDAIWIGLQKDSTNRMKWTDGYPMRYTHWGYGNPSSKPNENCVRMLASGEWDDIVCSPDYAPMCKYTTAPAPTPRPQVYAGYCPQTASGPQWEDTGLASCLLFDTTAEVTAATAMLNCRKKGGYLATLHDLDEIEFIKETTVHYKKNFWIGLTRGAADGTWEWADGTSPYEWNNWALGEPNNLGDDEDCVELIQDTGLWNDQTCTNTGYYICSAPKKPLTTVPPQWLTTTNPFEKPVPQGQDRQKGDTIKPVAAALGGVGGIGVVLAIISVILVVLLGYLFVKGARGGGAGRSEDRNGSTSSGDPFNRQATATATGSATGSSGGGAFGFLKRGPKPVPNAAAGTANLAFDNATYSSTSGQAELSIPEQNPSRPPGADAGFLLDLNDDSKC